MSNELEKKLENGWVIVVENYNPAIIIEGKDNGKNNSKIRVWAYHPSITNYPNIKGSNLTPYLKKGYRNSEGIDFKTEYLWMWVELLESRLNKLNVRDIIGDGLLNGLVENPNNFDETFSHLLNSK